MFFLEEGLEWMWIIMMWLLYDGLVYNGGWEDGN